MPNSFVDYNCRHCGQRFTLGSQLDFPQVLEVYARRDQLVCMHVCGPAQAGIADLIGARAPADQKV